MDDTAKGKYGLWSLSTLEIEGYIFRNPIECSMCTRNDRDARLAERCLLLRASSLCVYMFFFMFTLVLLPRENSVLNN